MHDRTRMGILTKLLAGPFEQYDFECGSVGHRRAHTALAAGDRGPAEAIVDQLGPDARIDVLAFAAPEIPIERFQEWADADASGLALALLGAAQIRDAWTIRGDSLAADVEPSAWAPFHAGLRTAEDTLLEAARADPYAALPWELLLRSGVGLSMSAEVMAGRFDEAHARSPFSARACAAMTNHMSPQWNGSRDDVLVFGRWVHKNAPRDASAQAALPNAHIEIALATKLAGGSFSDYLGKRTVQTEVIRAAERFLEATPSRAPINALAPLNAFAMAIPPTSVRAASCGRELVRRIAQRPTAHPWRYWGNPVTVYRRQARHRIRIARRFC